MIYIERIKLPSLDRDYTPPSREFDFLNSTHKSAYPFHVLSFRGLFEVVFDDVTIITGGNGTGKSTLLNIIAQKLKLRRPTPFNNSEYFDRYLKLCRIDLSSTAHQLSAGINEYGRIISSDEVFDYMIETRLKNDEIDERRKTIVADVERMRDDEMPDHIDLEDPESIRAYLHQCEVKKKSRSKYIKDHLGFNISEFKR